MKVTRFVLLSALMWFTVGCPQVEIPGELAVSTSDCDVDMDVDTDTEPVYGEECAMRVYEETEVETCFGSKDIDLANVRLSEPLPECNDHCEVWLSGYERCLDECWDEMYCAGLLFEYEICVGTPVEPEGNCEELEGFYRTCANTLGPNHYSCWVFHQEMLYCWLQEEGGWCDNLEGMYHECVDLFGDHHYGCQELGWELSNDCGYWVEPPYYEDCYYLEDEFYSCQDVYGSGSEMCWGYEETLIYECWDIDYPDYPDYPDIDTDTETDWNWDYDTDTDSDCYGSC